MGFEMPDGFEIISPHEIDEERNASGTLAEGKYFEPRNSYFSLPERTWPNNKIEEAPIWCSVDLRDGNQSLETPMNTLQKLHLFKILVEMGYKEIEVGFPSASAPDYEFIREIIEHDLIPDDVTIQVLCQCKENLVQKTRQAVEGARNVIVHMYNSTSEVQREIVFQHGQSENKEMALESARLVKQYFGDFKGKIVYQYSAESFTGTELDYAEDVCRGVIDTRGGTEIILNFPATVENSTPNVYADKVEYMIGELHECVKGKTKIITSLHPHNDRGTAIAAAEQGVMAGADRVEGCILDFGERSGNLNIVTMAMNLFSQGIDPKIVIKDLYPKLLKASEITGTPISERQPYVGKLIHTAYSGSHQDAIKKALDAQNSQGQWENPYLPIDPDDIGMQYRPIVVNSQSGKGGVAYVIENAGYQIPKKMQPIISQIIQGLSESSGGALEDSTIISQFESYFINKENGITDKGFVYNGDDERGEVNQLADFMSENYGVDFHIIDYSQHAMNSGRDADAITFFEIEYNGKSVFGIGRDSDVTKSHKKGLISALNIALES